MQAEPHLAFVTDDIEAALEGKEILMPLYQPFAGYRCAVVAINHQLIELIETILTEREIRGNAIFRDSILYPDEAP